MIFEQIDAGGDRNFSYLIGDERSRACAVVDPGYDTANVEARVRALGLHVAYVPTRIPTTTTWRVTGCFTGAR